jgi:5-methyltetrahydrofolate--homocysteine methyltransferase
MSMKEIAEQLIHGRAEEVSRLVAAELARGTGAGELLDGGLIAGMAEVGARFRACEIFVPEVLAAARAMHAGLELLEPRFAEAGIEPAGTVVIGTVKGDIHDIGKNLVAMMLRGAGFRVIDLGVDVPPSAFVEAVRTHAPQVVGLSALLTTTMMAMKTTVAALRAEVPEVRVLVGGAPVTPAFAEAIGADGYGATATDGVERALALVGRG